MHGIGSIAKCYTIFPRSRKREKSRVDHGLLIVNDLLLKMVDLCMGVCKLSRCVGH